MSIVTKTGDKGETGLFGGQRIAKDDVRMEAIGTVDELNAVLGVVLANAEVGGNLRNWLTKTQNMLFRAGADLATPRENNNAVVPRIEQSQIDEVEAWVVELEQTPLPPYFVLPGGSKAAAELHLARAICRRAERCTVALSKKADTGLTIITYLNRLSDFLFLASLEANRDAGTENMRVSYT